MLESRHFMTFNFSSELPIENVTKYLPKYCLTKILKLSTNKLLSFIKNWIIG